MKKKFASIVLVAMLANAVLLILVGNAVAGMETYTKAVPEEEWNRTFDKASSNFSPLLTAELDKSEVKRGKSVNVSGNASGTDVVDIVVIGPRGLRRMPDSITSEIALADGFRFMTLEVAGNNSFKAEIRIPEEIYRDSTTLWCSRPAKMVYMVLLTGDVASCSRLCWIILLQMEGL